MLTTTSTTATATTTSRGRVLGSVLAATVIVLGLSVTVQGSEHDQQGCAQYERLFLNQPCVVKPAGVWQLEFGTTKLPAPIPVQLTQMDHKSGPENVFTRGLNIVTPPKTKDPIDCAMERPVTWHRDRAMVKPIQSHVTHSGVVVSAPSCREK